MLSSVAVGCVLSQPPPMNGYVLHLPRFYAVVVIGRVERGVTQERTTRVKKTTPTNVGIYLSCAQHTPLSSVFQLGCSKACERSILWTFTPPKARCAQSGKGAIATQVMRETPAATCSPECPASPVTR